MYERHISCKGVGKAEKYMYNTPMVIYQPIDITCMPNFRNRHIVMVILEIWIHKIIRDVKLVTSDQLP